MRKPGLWIGLLALIAAPFVLFPSIVGWRLEAALRSEMRAQSARVSLRGGLGTFRGNFSRLAFTVRGGQLDGVPVSEMTGEFSRVELDVGEVLGRGRLAITRIGSGRASLTLTADDIRRYLVDQKGLHGMEVGLDDGKVHLRGKVSVLNYEIDAILRGRLVVADGARVVMRVETLAVSGVALPPSVAEALAASMNPLLRVDDFPLAMRLVEVAVDDGRAVVQAVVPP